MARNSKYKKQDEQKLWKPAFYIRLSDQDDNKDESNSVINQKSIICNFVNTKSDFGEPEIYIDDGFSGRDFERPNFQKMIKDMEDKKFNCIVVKDLSRLGRTYIECGYYIEKLFPINSIRFISINENIDLGNENGKQNTGLSMPLKNVFNGIYSKNISEKVRYSIENLQRNGKYVASFTPYGYKKNPQDKHKLIIDEDVREVIEIIFTMYSEGIGYNRIAKHLNSLGILCPTEYKKSYTKFHNGNIIDNSKCWTVTTILKILKDEIYIGNLVQNKRQGDEKKFIHVLETHEAIISNDVWNKVQSQLAKNKHMYINKFDNVSNIFASKLECSKCGRTLIKEKGKYACKSYKIYGKNICIGCTITYEDLYDTVFQSLKMNISELVNIEELIKNADKNKIKKLNLNNTYLLRSQIELLERKNKNLYENYKLKLLTRVNWIQEKQEISEQIVKLNEELEAIKQSNTIKTNEKNTWLELYKKYIDIDILNNDIINVFIDKIIIDSDKKIIINWKYQEEIEKLNNMLREL